MLGAAAAWTLPLFLERTFGALDAEAADSAVQTTTGKDGRILVVLQLAGGNDGLNTVIPWADDAYHRVRPGLRLASEKVLKLNDYAGLHPQLAGIRGLFDAGHAAIVQGVGYPNPDRSHFRSMDIWETASDANKFESTGWLGRFFDHNCKGADPAVGVSIGNTTPTAFAAENPTGISFSRPEAFRRRSQSPDGADELFRSLNSVDSFAGMEANDGGSIGGIEGKQARGANPLEFLQRTALDAQMSSDEVMRIVSKTKAPANYPKNQLGEKLGLVARMIAGGMPTRVYYVSQGGYDTHSNQSGAHERLLGELSEAVTAFTGDLKAQGNFERVLLMTFSEFGRRVAQNGSGGTDHGAAAPLFVIGGSLNPGFVGKHPSLTDLDRGDLRHTVDFRSVYGTVLEGWLNARSEQILGRKFPTLPFLKT
jgi:uncharacterized protein (DUF1501 family)